MDRGMDRVWVLVCDQSLIQYIFKSWSYAWVQDMVRKVVRGQGQKFADLVRGQSQKLADLVRGQG